MEGEMKHGKWHLACCVKPLAGKVLWLLSLVALVMAWAASANPNGLFLKLPVAHLFWDALVLGVLALGLKNCGHGHGAMCESCDEDEK